MTDQIRRSSGSVGGQIAEAGEKKISTTLISKLTDADGEQLETQHWIEMGMDVIPNCKQGCGTFDSIQIRRK